MRASCFFGFTISALVRVKHRQVISVWVISKSRVLVHQSLEPQEGPGTFAI